MKGKSWMLDREGEKERQNVNIDKDVGQCSPGVPRTKFKGDFFSPTISVCGSCTFLSSSFPFFPGAASLATSILPERQVVFGF